MVNATDDGIGVLVPPVTSTNSRFRVYMFICRYRSMVMLSVTVSPVVSDAVRRLHDAWP